MRGYKFMEQMMINFKFFLQCFVILTISCCNHNCYSSTNDTIAPRYKVTLSEAHIGNLDIDTKLLDSYELLPENIRQFYLDARFIFYNTPDADFTNPGIIEAAREHDLQLMGGPMLGNLSKNGVILWLRPAISESLVIIVTKSDGTDKKTYLINSVEPGVEKRIAVDGLSSDTDYKYAVYANKRKIAEGGFITAPALNEKGMFRLVFGADFHKIGLHNPNLINEILKRKPRTVVLLGDIAVDDRENQINMHRADYLLRDVSKPWRQLTANIPIYSSWDDHDYFNNDLSGIPKGFTAADREAIRAVWHQNWNNPANESKHIYFNTQIGPVELIVLDTRSCRENEQRGQYGSYLGFEQLNWLKETLRNSEAPFKIICSGTMWSDYISNGKDSWGTWDIEAREELFNLLDAENISGVLLVSGDRHGARGFNIPRQSGFVIHEFEVGTLGGVPGPAAMAKDSMNQLFGYPGADIIAFGEFTFNTIVDKPSVIFRLIDEQGNILEEHTLSHNQLTPQK
jgi:alkaline phosphatase D